MKKILFALTFYFSLVLSAEVHAAANVYVDGNLAANCTSNNYNSAARNCTGSLGNAYQTLAGAFADAGVVAGTTIHVRLASTPYTATSTLSKSGSSGSPIIIQSFTGETAVIRNNAGGSTGAITVQNQNYITIRNLRFDGTGVTTSRNALHLRATTQHVVGITIDGNTFDDWGNNSQTAEGTEAVRCAGTETNNVFVWGIQCFITNNTFTNNLHTGIMVRTYGPGTIVANNTITGLRCGRHDNYSSGGRRGRQGIKFGGEGGETGTPAVIRGNTIASDSGNCSGIADVPGGSNFEANVGVYCDTGPENGIIERNLIHDVADEGIEIESRCHGWTVKYNVVRNASTGFRLSSAGVGAANNVTLINNTFSGITGNAIDLRNGSTFTFKNNIVHRTSGSGVVITAVTPFTTQSGRAFDYNIYLEDGTTDVGSWNGVTKTLATWRTICSCDANSLNVNPLLASNGTLSSMSSPAVNGGVNVGLLFNGSAPTLGAFDPPRFTNMGGGEVGLINPQTTILTFTNNVFPPIAPATSCTGFTREEENPPATWNNLAISACVRQGTNQIKLTHATATTGRAQRFQYSAGNFTDSALIGNTLSQPRLAITNAPITNNVGGALGFVLTQDQSMAFGIPLVGGALEARRPINQRVKVVRGGSVILAAQIKCTETDCPDTGAKAQGSWNGGDWFDIPDSDVTSVHLLTADGRRLLLSDGSGGALLVSGSMQGAVFAGSSNFVGTNYPEHGRTITGCLDDTGLTPTDQGIVLRTSAAVPTFTLAQDQCLTLGAMLTFGVNIVPDNVLRVRWIDQSGAPFTGTYVYAEATIVEYQGGVGF